MSVNTNLLIKKSGRTFQGIPKGMQYFIGEATVTGDVTGGNVECYCRFNSSSNPDFQPYVALFRASFVAQVADPVRGMGIRAENGQWESSADRTFDVMPTPVPTITETAQWVSAITRPVYLGRVAKGTQGQFSFRGTQVDTTVYNFNVAGFTAEFPFIARDYWVA